jgi:hypothetical protein
VENDCRHPWLVGGLGLCIQISRFHELKRKERSLLALVVLPVIADWVVPAFFGVGVQDYRLYSTITLLTAAPPMIWIVVLFFKEAIKPGSFRLPSYFAYEKILLLFIPIGLFSLGYGLLLGNSLKYIVSDAYKWFVFIPLYWLFYNVIPTQRAALVLNAFYRVMLSMLMISLFFVSWVVLIATPLKLHVAGIDVILPLLIILLMTRIRGRTPVLAFFNISKRKLLVLLFLAALALILSMERSLWFTLGIGIPLFFLVNVSKQSVLKRLKFGFAVILILFFVIGILWTLKNSGITPLKNFAESASERMEYGLQEIFSKVPQLLRNSFPADERIGSFDTKVREIIDGWNHMQNTGGWGFYFIGMGDGAQYPIVLASETSRSDDTRTGWNHNFHFSLMGIFFFKGGLGLFTALLFLGALFLVAYRAAKRLRNDSHPERAIVFKAFLFTFILSFIYYFTGGAMLYDYIFIFYTALFGKLLREQGNSSELQKNPARAVTP